MLVLVRQLVHILILLLLMVISPSITAQSIIPSTKLQEKGKKLDYEKAVQSKKKVSRKRSRRGQSALDSAYQNYQTQPVIALGNIERALKEAIINSDKKDQGRCYYLLGAINLNLLKYNEALANTKKSLELLGGYSNRNTDHNYKAFQLLPKIHEGLKDDDSALEAYITLVEKAKTRRDKKGEIEAKSGMARIYQKRKKYTKAKKLFEEVLQIQKVIGDKLGMAETQNSLGEIAMAERKVEEAIGYYNTSQDLNIQNNSIQQTNRTRDNIRNAYKSNNDIEELIEYQKSEIERVQSNKKDLAEQYTQLSNIYVENEKWDDAIQSIQQNINLAEDIKDYEKLSLSYKNLSKAYQQKGETEKALRSYENYVKSMDSLNAVRDRDLEERLAYNREIDEKQNRINSLQKDMELNEKELEVLKQEQELHNSEMRTQEIINYSLILILVLVLATSYLIYRSSKQKKIANQLLALKSLRSQMNPHFIFNALNSVNSFIAVNDERAANKYLSDFSKLMRSVMENSKHDLVSLESELSILKLYTHLEHFRFQEKFDYVINIDPEIDTEEIKIPPMLIQPYIENSVWHGLRYKKEKGHLKVELINHPKSIEFRVSDDGIGRKKSQELKTKNQLENQSTGLKNIQSRLTIINDLIKTNIQVDIKDNQPSQEDCGTIVSIKIPKADE